jgi:hypothetical protein
MTLVFLALHIVTAVVDPFTHLGWLTAVVPFSSNYRTFWLGLGTITFELLLAIVATSLARGFIGPPRGASCTGSRTPDGRSPSFTASAPVPTRGQRGSFSSASFASVRS